MRLDRAESRSKLQARREPYWQRVAEGQYIGFRRMSKDTPGTWWAKVYAGNGKYKRVKLGSLADVPEGQRYDAAKRKADAELLTHASQGGSLELVTVQQACEAYVAQRAQIKSEANAKDAIGRFTRLVYSDPIGQLPLAKLKPQHMSEWRERVLAKGGSRAGFNRNAATLKAALNLAHARLQVASNAAWRSELKPLDNAVHRRELYLDGAKRRRLLQCSSAEVRPFFTTLHLLPLRPGEAAALRVENLSVKKRELVVPHGKTKARKIPLPAEVVAHLEACAKGKLPSAWLLSRANGEQWKKEAWRDEMKAAVRKAKLPRAAVAYNLRHSTITDLVVGGLDVFTVAQLAGTSVVMIDQHYGHLVREHARTALERLANA